MSGVLTITTTYVAGDPGPAKTTVTRTGEGEPDVTERVLHETDMFGRQSVSKNIFGDAGDDVLVGDSITFQLHGGDGNDTITSVGGGAPFGWLVGADGDDWLRGGASDDLLEAGSGNDTIDGGAGFDMARFGGASGLTVDLRILGPQQTGEGLDVLTGVEGVTGGDFDDSLTGDAGANQLQGGAGDDVVYGLGGDDTITDQGHYTDDWGQSHADSTRDYLRGGDGNDSISGGEEFDDLNGNAGADTVSGGDGDDWVAGGQDGDVLAGDGGADLVLGNLGNDTAGGDAGNDTVRGGQGDDSLTGGDGNDWLSGDLGSDTISGGAGADIFHSFGATGLDRVTDFNAAEGDRVQLDPGVTYEASQSGADVVLALSGGGQVVLAGVSLAALTGGWIISG